MTKRIGMKYIAVLLITFILATLSACAPSTSGISEGKGGELKIHFIDVGQADAILVQQGSASMLIDAGNNGDGESVKKYLSSQGITKLDYVIGTHPHEDHIGGLDVMIDSFDVGMVYMPKASSTTATFKDVIKAINNKNLKVTTPNPGGTFKLGEAEVQILAPNGKEYKDLNNYSIALRLTFGSNSFLFMGDAEVKSEKEILGKGFEVRADLIKIGHHGSISSTSEEFLDRVNPKYAVIMVGDDNTYKHPHKPVMDRLKAKGIKVYRTDECGTIVATSDGKEIKFNVKPGSYSYRGTGE